MQEQPLSYIERSKLEKNSDSPSRKIADGILESKNQEELLESWKNLESYMKGMGFEKKDTDVYLSSLMLHHGQEIIVRRGSLFRTLDAVQRHSSIDMLPLDQEPNASLLGNGKGDQNGIEVALTGGFGWFVENKVAGVYGFLPEHSSLEVKSISQGSLSETKQGSSLMRRVEGTIDADDMLFFLLRAHKSAFPEQLLQDEDYDGMTGEINPFILRLYAKSRQSH